MQTKRARSRRWIPFGAALLAAGAVGSATAFLTAATLGGTATTVQETVVAAQDAALKASSSPSAIYAADSPGVVDITATTSEPDPFGRAQSAEAEGSGFVVDSSGHIVTNAHVVEGASSITVTFSDGTKASATLVGSDESTDIAVLDVNVSADELHPLTLGDSSTVEVGDAVVAIGSPFGYAESITSGIVSALGREIQAPNGSTISNVIQTDAAINSGNSGGPLIDANGQVIGVSAQISSSSGGSDGVGFAIPSNTVKQAVERMLGVNSL
jgi:putative serine protease PepD